MKSKTATLKTVVTYLEMKQFTGEYPVFPDGVVVQAAKPVAVQFYRYLYDAVGNDVGWTDRKILADEELKKILDQDDVDIHLLMFNGVPAGFAELDRTKFPEIELKYFGLMPEYRGRGLGALFLKWVIRKAWEYHPQRLWLHTNDRDHPAALKNYLRHGFVIYDQRVEDQLVIED